MNERGETAIRQIVERWTRAIQAKDVDGIFEPFDPAAVSFDVIGPMRQAGAEAARARAAAWFASFDGPIGFEVRDLVVHADAAAGFAHYLYRVAGRLHDGTAVRMWVRATLGCRVVDGAWRVTHAHYSVPFDGATGQASLGLEP